MRRGLWYVREVLPLFLRSIAAVLILLVACARSDGAVPKPTPAKNSVYAPGACVTMEPPSGTPRATVFLDAGHGGFDPGATGRLSDGRPVREKDVALALVLDAAERLRSAGYRVVVSRTSDTLVAALGPADVKEEILTARGKKRDLQMRIRCANLARASVLLSVHFNAFSDPREGGIMTFYDPDRPFARDNLRLARLVHARVLGAIRGAGVEIQDRRVIRDTVSMGRKASTTEAARYGHEPLLGPRDPSYVPAPSSMPGAILETMFITRPEEADFATNEAGRGTIAQAIADALIAFLAAK